MVRFIQEGNDSVTRSQSKAPMSTSAAYVGTAISVLYEDEDSKPSQCEIHRRIDVGLTKALMIFSKTVKLTDVESFP